MSFEHSPNPFPSVGSTGAAAIVWGPGPVAADLGHPGTPSGFLVNEVDVKQPFEHEKVRNYDNRIVLDVAHSFENTIDVTGTALTRYNALNNVLHQMHVFAMMTPSALACLRASDMRGWADPVSGFHEDDYFLCTKAETKIGRMKLPEDSYSFEQRRLTIS